MHHPSRSSHYSQLQPEDRVTVASLRQQNYSGGPSQDNCCAQEKLRTQATFETPEVDFQASACFVKIADAR